MRPVSVALLIADLETQAYILVRAQANAIKVERNAALWIRGNSKELYSVFLNLVSNAIRYSPAGGDIILR
ncbi:MAG TPA: hypothetical protein VHJ19_12840 [Gammaproteobacteria bacterium]|nr:hypothetical protein [Gammaproteobacteria bacterium]